MLNDTYLSALQSGLTIVEESTDGMAIHGASSRGLIGSDDYT